MTEKAKNEDCEYVSEKVCDARMDALDTKMNYLFGTALITIALELGLLVVTLLKGA